MVRIPVELAERRYTIAIGDGLVARLPQLLAKLRGRRLVVVSNARVWSLHGASLVAALSPFGPLRLVRMADGERHKSWATLRSLCDGFLRAGLGRDGVVVAFGGGVVGDAAGFAAATYMRGIAWVQVPTTLLAMVDSSVGGKVAINHARAKNLVGAFHQPAMVVVDPSLLATLPAREAQSGAYEVLKCAVLGDRALFRGLQRLRGEVRSWPRPALVGAIAAACRLKAGIVGKDEREGGLRRVLNLGHTLGHALEAATHYRRYTHGEAVGWGLIGACEIARGRGLLAAAAADSIAEAVDALGPRPPLSDLSVARLLAALAHDKKGRAGRVPFVLPTRIGRVVIRGDVSRTEIRRAVTALARRERRRG